MARFNVSEGIGIVVALTVMMLLAAFLLPVAISSVNAEETVTLSVSEGQTQSVTHDLNVTGYNISDSSNTAVYNLTKELEDGGVEDGTLDFSGAPVGATANITFQDGDEYTAVFQGYESEDTTTLEFNYAQETTWDGGAAAIWGIIPLIAIVVVFLTIVGWAAMQAKEA